MENVQPWFNLRDLENKGENVSIIFRTQRMMREEMNWGCYSPMSLTLSE